MFQPIEDYDEAFDEPIRQIVLVFCETEYTTPMNIEDMNSKVMIDYFERVVNRLGYISRDMVCISRTEPPRP